MPDVDCPVAGCDYKTGDFDNVVVAALLTTHAAGAHSAVQRVQPVRRPPKVDRPILVDNLTEESWNAFKQSWDIFVQVNDVYLADQTVQLFSCCDSQLKAKVTAIENNILSKDFDTMLDLVKNLAVIPVAVSVKRNDLLRMHQDDGELIRAYHSRIMGKAITCNFKIKCTHEHSTAGTNVLIDYTNEMIRHVILNGLYDDEIRRDIFGQRDLETMSVSDLISLIEGKETAREATTCPSANAFSQYRKGFNNKPTPARSSKQSTDFDQKGKCSTCGNIFKLFKKMANGKVNKKPFINCQDCWKINNPRNTGGGDHKDNVDASAVSFSINVVQDTSSIPSVLTNRKNDHCEVATSTIQQKPFFDHHIFENGNWMRKMAQPHPTLKLTLSVDPIDYNGFGLGLAPKVESYEFTAIIDSGAQCCLWGWQGCKAAGFCSDDLIPVKQKLNAVSKSHITIFGAVILRLSGNSVSGTKCSSAVMAYVSPDVSGFYLSREAMVQLQIVSTNFPSVGGVPMARVSILESVCQSNGECSCPRRELPPGPPEKFPLPCIPENAEKMKEWLLDRYKNSTFNTCPHQILPNMEGPPIEIHIDPQSQPVAVHTPSPIPLHWQDKVERDLKRDVSLGVIEPVPHGEPSTWCHRMVLTRKHTGEPRRTVDLSPLNKHCLREVHAMRSPFELAKGVPEKTWRTVVDAWNGFHSVPLRNKDKHLTAFITPWGRFRYLRAPQGFASSGDGYNRRFDEILRDFERHKRCVDDVLTFDNDLEEHWWRIIELLELLGKHGIVVNPEKFQFSQKQVDFAGFRLTDVGVEPLPKYLNAINNFPVPQSLTDIRSWFGLVNQVSHYAQLRDLMEPFRKFLSPKTKFYWDGELNTMFELSKIQIIDAIKDGVQIFDPKRKTCVRCDWSKLGIGFYLCQKHCECPGEYPDCCNDGWRITLCGSRFLKPSEKTLCTDRRRSTGSSMVTRADKVFHIRL